MTSPRSFREAFTEDPADVKTRLAAMNAARHALIALRLAHNVPELTTGHGFSVSTGCVTMDLGQMGDALRRFFLDDFPALVAERDSARDWAVVLENRIEKALEIARFLPIGMLAEIISALTGGGDDARP